MNFLFLFLIFAPLVFATCDCPDNLRGSRNEYWVIQGCNDVELQGECRRGNWELENYIGAIMGYADKILDAKMRQSPPVTADWVGRNRAALSDAVEFAKPIINCDRGVFTQTRNQNTRSHCFSPELLEECTRLLNSVSNYQLSIISRLNQLDIDPEFVTLMRIRVEKAMTLDVSCEVSKHVMVELSGAGKIVPQTIAIGLILIGLF
jgi:hypothetical protein